MQHAGSQLKLPHKLSKTTEPTSDPVTILGIMFYSDGRLEPDADKPRDVIARTRRMLKQNLWNPRELEEIVGCWNWFILLRRPVFAVISELYKWIHSSAISSNQTTRPPSPGARMELSILCDIAPLLHAHLRRPWAVQMNCTDSSQVGAGGVYAPFLPWHPTFSTIQSNAFTSLRQGLELTLPELSWKTAIRHKWTTPGHINVLETEDFLLMARWYLRHRQYHGTRVACHVDSQVLYYLLRRGRSSAYGLGRVARTLAAIILCGNLEVEVVWLPSEQNPADAASRSF